MGMPELRLNLISREWVIIPGKDAKSPEDFIGPKVMKRHPEYLEACPFCPGNEEKTPDETFRIRNHNGWSVRVVWNRFSKLSREGPRCRSNCDVRRSVSGVGSHEVIIESPVHNHTTATMPPQQLRDTLVAYRERFAELYGDTRIEHVVIFKNSGNAAGTTIEHPLAQIVGVPVTPLTVRSRIEGALRFFDETGDCLMCRTVRDELNEGRRILVETQHFVSFVPYAALSPFHIWIFPKRHTGSFADTGPAELHDLAMNLRTTMGKLHYGLEQPDFNYVLRSGKPSQKDSEYIHWYISIVPRLSMATGFELGSGMYINPLVPEVSAQFLQNVRTC